MSCIAGKNVDLERIEILPNFLGFQWIEEEKYLPLPDQGLPCHLGRQTSSRGWCRMLRPADGWTRPSLLSPSLLTLAACPRHIAVLGFFSLDLHHNCFPQKTFTVSSCNQIAGSCSGKKSWRHPPYFSPIWGKGWSMSLSQKAGWLQGMFGRVYC